MRGKALVVGGSAGVVLMAAAGLIAQHASAQANRPSVPQFEPDPLWSQTLPNKWVNGQVGGVAIAPGVPNSATEATAQANQSFQSAFRSNAVSPLVVDLNTFPSGTLKTPYFEQWSLGLERDPSGHTVKPTCQGSVLANRVEFSS